MGSFPGIPDDAPHVYKELSRDVVEVLLAEPLLGLTPAQIALLPQIVVPAVVNGAVGYDDLGRMAAESAMGAADATNMADVLAGGGSA